MQPRLMRSRNEVIISGVCGGLAEYFGIDPVIVRLIFVLVTLTSGLGLLVYPILWLVMPKAGAPVGSAQQLFPQDPEEWRRRAHALGEEAAQFGQHVSREVREVLLREQPQQAQSRTAAPPRTYEEEPPPPHAYNFDPLTGQPIRPSSPSTGQTVNLGFDPTLAPTNLPPTEISAQFLPPPAPTPVAPAARRQRSWRWLGIVLVAFGALILADQFGIDLDILFPIMMIGGGLMLLRRR
jgi:phage shock protein C